MTGFEQDPTTDTALERRFRRLLRAYPAWYRKERGEEMLTTLMDASGERDRPTAGQRFDIVFGGLRKHLSVGSVPAAVVGVFAALFVATLGAIGGSVAGWHTATDLPDDATADRIAQQAIPDIDTTTHGDRSLFYWDSMMGEPMDTVFTISDGDDHNAGRLIYEMEHDIDNYARFDEAKERMAAAGWEIQSVRKQDGSADLSAYRDGLDLNISTVEDSSSPSLSFVYIYRHTPTLVPVLTVVGFIVGGLVGWLVTGRLRRRASGWSAVRHAFVAVPLGIGGLLLVLPTAINLYYIGASLVMPEERVPIWLGYTFGPPAMATLAAAAALALAALSDLVGTTVRLVVHIAR